MNYWNFQNIACLSTNRYRHSQGCIWACIWAGSISNQFSWLFFQVLPLPRSALKFIWTPRSCDIIFKLFSLTYRPRIVYKVELPVFSIFIIAKCCCGLHIWELCPLSSKYCPVPVLSLSLLIDSSGNRNHCEISLFSYKVELA